MSGFNTKERNNNGEYEITFYTESQQDFEKVQDLCRELIGHNKPVSIKDDLISRNALKKVLKENEWITDDPFAEGGGLEDIIDNVPTVSFMISPDYVTELQNLNKELIKQLEEAERPQGKWSDLSTDGRHIGWVACSVCGQEPPSESNLRTDFCPNCGADMRGGAE